MSDAFDIETQLIALAKVGKICQDNKVRVGICYTTGDVAFCTVLHDMRFDMDKGFQVVCIEGKYDIWVNGSLSKHINMTAEEAAALLVKRADKIAFKKVKR